MKKFLLSAALFGIAAGAMTARGPKDPVVMTVDGRDVRLSEFEYLYNKNNAQQLNPIDFNEYVDMFVNYKLKVADALAAGIDTTAEYRREFNKFRRDLAMPYLRDTILEEQLILEAYDHTAENVYVSHIMFANTEPSAQALADSVRNEIIAGNITFEDAARTYSIDRNSKVNGGRMGWVSGNHRFPWAFEKASYDTPVGEISQPVNSGMGFHLVRPEERRANPGEVKARHILLLTRNVDAEAAETAHRRIDSLYQVLQTPEADFSDIAARFSDDRGTAARGGDLGWFGAGTMVQPFDSIAFALGDGEMSEPFLTSFGWHIILKDEHRGRKSLEEMRPEIEQAIAGDERSQQPVLAYLRQVAAASNSQKSTDYVTAVNEILAAAGGTCTPETNEAIANSNATAYIANGAAVPLSTVLAGKMLANEGDGADVALEMVSHYVNQAYNEAMIQIGMDMLERDNASYRNLLNEYRDGILLFDISNEKVWDRASKDKEGLENYFNQNIERYATWTAPKYKAYIIFAQADSVLTEVNEYVASAYPNANIRTLNQEEFTNDLRDRFGRKIKVERVIAAQGENAITDYLGFGAEKPEPTGSWKYYFAFADEIVPQPVEASDARGAVVADYQAELERQWVEQLRNTYSFSLNRRNLQKANK